MSEINEQLARLVERYNLAIGIVIAISASLAGAVMVGGPLGGIIGLIAGSAVALALCGAIAMMAAILAMARSEVAQAPLVHVAGQVAAAAAPRANDGLLPAGVPAGTANGHAAPAGAIAAGAPPAAASEITETEAQMLNTGKFSAYHLAKAKRLFAEGNLKEAAYQAGASLAHDPQNLEAIDLRRRASAR